MGSGASGLDPASGCWPVAGLDEDDGFLRACFGSLLPPEPGV